MDVVLELKFPNNFSVEIARNLLNIGDPVEKIITVTGLTFEDVENIRRANEK